MGTEQRIPDRECEPLPREPAAGARDVELWGGAGGRGRAGPG